MTACSDTWSVIVCIYYSFSEIRGLSGWNSSGFWFWPNCLCYKFNPLNVKMLCLLCLADKEPRSWSWAAQNLALAGVVYLGLAAINEHKCHDPGHRFFFCRKFDLIDLLPRLGHSLLLNVSCAQILHKLSKL